MRIVALGLQEMHGKHGRIVSGQINRDRKQTGGCQELGWRENGTDCRQTWGFLAKLWNDLKLDGSDSYAILCVNILKNTELYILNGEFQPGIVAHACNPSVLGGQSRQIAWVQEFKTSLGNMVKPYLYKSYKN